MPAATAAAIVATAAAIVIAIETDPRAHPDQIEQVEVEAEQPATGNLGDVVLVENMHVIFLHAWVVPGICADMPKSSQEDGRTQFRKSVNSCLAFGRTLFAIKREKAKFM